MTKRKEAKKRTRRASADSSIRGAQPAHLNERDVLGEKERSLLEAYETRTSTVGAIFFGINTAFLSYLFVNINTFESVWNEPLSPIAVTANLIVFALGAVSSMGTLLDDRHLTAIREYLPALLKGEREKVYSELLQDASREDRIQSELPKKLVALAHAILFTVVGLSIFLALVMIG